MGASYDIVRQRQTVQVLGPDDVRDVLEVTLRTKPSGVIYPLNVPTNNATPDHIAQVAEGTAALIEADLTHRNVQAITFTQEPDVTGILRLIAHVYVASDGQEGQAVVDMIAPDLNEPQFSDRIAPTVSNLNAIQGL